MAKVIGIDLKTNKGERCLKKTASGAWWARSRPRA